MPSLAPGLHLDVPESDYHALEYASSSTLRRLAMFSPAHARVGMAESEALVIGSALHAATLEPETMGSRFYFPGIHKPDGRTSVGKAQRAATEEAAGNLPILWREDADGIAAMRRAVWGNSSAVQLLTGATREATIIWDDPDTGATCKARLDVLRMISPTTCFVADIKTTAKPASPGSFSRTFQALRYHMQAAWYCEAVRSLGWTPQEFFFIVVEKVAPHGVVVYRVKNDAMNEGELANRIALAEWARCMDHDEWPGYTNAVQEVGLSTYFKGDAEQWQLVNEE